MDPNVLLSQLREAIAELRGLANGDSNDAEIDAGHRVADMVDDLDEWLSRGGFFPEAWLTERRRPVTRPQAQESDLKAANDLVHLVRRLLDHQRNHEQLSR